MSGPVEQEAARLAAAVQDWIARTFPAQDGGHGAHLATGAPECTWCPVCQLISVLRGDRPEVTERLVEAGIAVLGAVRSLFDATPAARDVSPAEPTEVQRIRLTEPDEDGRGPA